MLEYIVILFVLHNLYIESNVLGSNENIICPSICTCRLEHLTGTAIYRFMKKDKSPSIPGEHGTAENNDAIYEESLDTIHLLEEHGFIVVRSAICMLQTETEPTELLNSLPENIESLTLIQGYESGNKTLKFTYLNKFSQLIAVELVGPNLLNQPQKSHLICEIDSPIAKLKYLNLERIVIRNSKRQVINLLNEIKEDVLNFEFVQKLDGNSHSVTMVQKGMSDEEILPYEVFKQQKETNGDIPLFVGFKKLTLLRITNCELNNINWEMFDGLHELQYLILEKNNLRFIPAFAFHGTPVLKTLSLAHNKLLDIQITDLVGLLQLEYLDLSYNNFTQLSELSLPPFPKLKLANFDNNPIGVIFPNTFEVMNTTNSLIIGSNDISLTLIANSLVGLNLLKKLTVNNLKLRTLKRDLFVGMPSLLELKLTGNITEIEYDGFLEVKKLEKLIISSCKIRNISMDAFIGLSNLQYLDLSKNELEYLPPAVFDQLTSIKELYLNGNQFKYLPRDIFSKIHPKLLRLNENPWHCSCEMSEWKPMIVNKIKQNTLKPCEYSNDKGIACGMGNMIGYKYIYDNKIAPKCKKPVEFVNWNIFHAMRRILKCPNYKPKIRKHYASNNSTLTSYTLKDITTIKSKYHNMTKLEKLHYKLTKHSQIRTDNKNSTIQVRSSFEINGFNNHSPVNNYEPIPTNNLIEPKKLRRRFKKGYRRFRQKYNN